MRRHVAEWVFLICALLGIGGVFGYVQYQDYQHIAQQERERLSSQAAVVEKNIGQQLRAARRGLETIVQDVPHWRAQGRSRAQSNERLATLTSTMIGVSSIIVIDAAGRVVAADQERLLGLDMSSRSYYRAAHEYQRSDVLYVSPPFLTALNFISITIALVIPDKQGKFGGMVVAALNPEFFSVQLDSVLYAQDAWTYLAHGDGKLFMMRPERGDLVGKDLRNSSSFLVQHLASGRSGSVYQGRVYVTGEDRVIALRSIQPAELLMDKPLVIAVSRDSAGIHFSWKSEALLGGSLFAAVVLVSVLALYFYQRRQRYYDHLAANAEYALRESEAKFRLLFEQAAVGVALIDSATGRFLTVNRKYGEIVGYSDEEMRALDFQTITHPDDLALDLDNMARLKSGEIRAFEMEKRYIHKAGHVVWIKLTVSPMWEPGAMPDRHVAVVQDISEQKRNEMELVVAKKAAEDASASKSRFLAAASHDLRQPIQALNLFHAALERTALNEEQRRLSRYLALSVNSLSELLNALLDISRLESDAVTPAPVVIPLEDLFSRIDAEFSPLATERSLRFKLFYPEGECAVVADSNLLTSILSNLIGNAIKYTEDGGILVAVRRRGTQALLQVWDTGIGIAPEHLESIYDPYFQVGNPERDRNKGLGLGLSIVRLVADLMKVKIVCHSRLGRGTCFEFHLPLVDGDHDAEAAETYVDVEMEDFAVEGYRIVVVDDDALVATATQASLEALGMDVTLFRNAEDALASADVLDADFYISDFRLPGMDGILLLLAIQQRSSRPIRAVLLTGDGSTIRSGALRPPQWPVLFKPIELEKLLAVMRDQGLGE